MIQRLMPSYLHDKVCTAISAWCTSVMQYGKTFFQSSALYLLQLLIDIVRRILRKCGICKNATAEKTIKAIISLDRERADLIPG
ncbi:hypothetical protein H4S14_002546 [Agrobacterium vitis]|nr:hypothetical protein [Agrobacterium vitis]MBE1438790.1 hypothetical protein [Agrobacterium vitis]